MISFGTRFDSGEESSRFLSRFDNSIETSGAESIGYDRREEGGKKIDYEERGSRWLILFIHLRLFLRMKGYVF